MKKNGQSNTNTHQHHLKTANPERHYEHRHHRWINIPKKKENENVIILDYIHKLAHSTLD